MMNFRNLLPDFAGSAAVEGWAGTAVCATRRGPAGVATGGEVMPACGSAEAPHFSQNFAPTESATPHPVQKLGVSTADGTGARVPQVVQNG